ncbi:DEAD-box ATP-dependent RNA helicase 28 [Typha angustifolia]|uniref:DEAD-box ATP-dependent RNA helicase 28 n=1 Tax=Typha angustifolia TaxID=59011 RepID=UPI003C2B9786
MDPDFRFEGASSDEEATAAIAKRETQSPWEFSSYSESVNDEHARRKTTSVDAKISRVLEECPISLPNPDDDEYDEEEEEDDDEVLPTAKESNSISIRPESNNSKCTDGKSSGGGAFFSSAEGASFHADSFFELNLSRPLLRACDALGYHKPTPIQAACIPLALTGRDICGSAITGSGKTAAFTLPVLERLLFRPKRVPAIRVLILTPTRELAAQVHSMIEKLAQFTDIRCCLIVGGLPTKMQETALRSMPDIVVATPGRIIDHIRNTLSVGLEDLAILIFDEADRLLELGFSAEIHELIRMCPKRRQTMLFSATMTEEVDKLVKLSLNKPVRLEADPSLKRPSTLTEEVVRIRRTREANQEAVLLALCSKTFTQKVIIFSGTKQAAHRLKIIFGLAGMKAAELHGNLTQTQRLEALELFRKQEVDFLIATDVAARGIDIVGVQTVINFACPRDDKTYLHRVGRTARAGREGYAVTFVTDDDRSLLKAIAKKAGSQLKSRIVAEKPIAEWSELIEQLEEQISAIHQEEREEMVLRKAEMEATKAENMIAHKEEIYSRPKRTWFTTEKEKKLLAKAAKDFSMDKNRSGSKEVMSIQQAEELKLKEKRRREREKNLPRKKRRKLEAAREMLENEEEDNNVDQETEAGKKKKGQSLVDLAYRRAKSVKAMKKGNEGGKLKNSAKRVKKPSQNVQTRKEEMHELFQSDMSESKQDRSFKKSNSVTGRKKSKSSFKSKSRYKRRK